MSLFSTNSDESIQNPGSQREWAELLQTLRHEADNLEELGALVDGAAMIRRITGRVESLLTSVTVGQKEAAELSGYSPDHIRRLERQGQIPNWGSRHAPRYPVTQIPVKGAAARYRQINAQRAAS